MIKAATRFTLRLTSDGERFEVIVDRLKLARHYKAHPEDRLTNWQRKQWAKAGYPRDAGSLAKFARLQKDGTELYTGEILLQKDW